MDEIVSAWIENLTDNRTEMLDKISNTGNNDILRLRNQAAECGIEMTPAEIKSYIRLMIEVLDG